MSIVASASLSGPAVRPDYRVRVFPDWPSAEAGWRAAARTNPATPFQSALVVGAWYGAMAGRRDLEPLLVTVHCARTGAVAMHLPLVRYRRRGVRTVAFADDHLMDANAPVLGPAAPRDREGASALLRALRGALPRADVLDLRKMPPVIGTAPNPLALVDTLPSELNGNVVAVGDDLEEYFRGTLKRTFRKELERSWRVFTREPTARFLIADTLEERRRLLAALERQQPLRMERVGKDYGLDEPGAADFYRRLVDGDPEGREVAIAGLVTGDQVVAGLMGLRTGRRFTMIRISHTDDPAWANASPGRLVIAQTMMALHADGVRAFDFSLGNFDYKRRFQVEPTPLVDFVAALTPLGLPAVLAARARVWLRDHPETEARVRRWLGRPPAIVQAQPSAAASTAS